MLQRQPGQKFVIVSAVISSAITSFVNGGVIAGLSGARYLALEARFNYAASGTSVTGIVQTRIETSGNWIDIANFTFAAVSGRKIQTLDSVFVSGQVTPTSGTMGSNTAQNGILSDEIRAIYQSVGDHGVGTGVTFVIYGVGKP